ncbi:MAG TPA: fasciclin domain-containing protein [Caulobacteraceae bacterium]|nr:fasciclin domain-containing protein [Caulobacteraceae bacterium]
MQLNRLILAAGASALLVGPLVAVAQPAATAMPAPPTAVAPSSPTGTLPASPHVVVSGDIVSTLQGSGHFTTLLKALDVTKLTTVLKTTPNITVFAPTDEAFQALPASQVAFLMKPANLPTLQKLLIYHLVNLPLDAAKIKGAKGPVVSVETSKLQIDGSGDPIKVNGADVIQSDIHASNGYIYVIDKVLVPPDMTLPAG